jgi:hypothetical protein
MLFQSIHFRITAQKNARKCNFDGCLCGNSNFLAVRPICAESLNRNIRQIGKSMEQNEFKKEFTGEQSSNVRAIYYDPELRELQITFKNGRYRYSDVPLEVFCDACAAESIGSFFASNIKRVFACENIPDEVVV